MSPTPAAGPPAGSGRLPEDYKPPLAMKAAYGSGQVMESIFTGAMGFVFFYYTAVLGVSGTLVGIAVFIGTCFDAGVDPVIGSFSDNLRSRFGRRLPLMFIGGPLTCLFLFLLFAAPPGLPPMGYFGWLVVMGVLLRVSISIYHVPYIALGAEMATGYVERSRVVAWRSILGILAIVAIIWFAYNVVFSGGQAGLQVAANYPRFGVGIALLSLVGVAICCVGLRRFAPSLPQQDSVDSALYARIWGEVKEIFSNRSFRVLFFSAVIFFSAQGAHANLNTHAYVFVWKLVPQQLQYHTYSYLLALIVGTLLAPLLLRFVEKRSAVILGIAIVVLAQTGLSGLRTLGLFTPVGGEALPWLVTNNFIMGLGTGFTLIAYPSMMADAVDEHEHLFGRRREGLYFAGMGFATKAATGLGVMVAGFALDLIRFQPGVIQPGTVIPEATLRQLTAIWGPVPAFLTAFSLLTLTLYTISRLRHAEIATALRRRYDGTPPEALALG